MPEPLHTQPVEDAGESLTRHLQLVGPTEVTMGVSDAAQAIRRRSDEWRRSALASLSLKPTIVRSNITLLGSHAEAAPQSPPIQCPPRLFGQLVAVIEAEAVEDGVSHIGEELISEIVASGEASSLMDATIATRTSLTASIVQLLGRLSPIAQSFRVPLIKHALQSKDIQLRDAAVQAIELWEDQSMIPLLRSHQEPIAWLNEYVIEVLKDLQG